MSRAVALAVVLALPALAAASPIDPREAAVAALVDAARADRASLCAPCVAKDPTTDCAAWGAPQALAPLHYEPRASDAARFHARHMHDGPCFQHASCCTLGRNQDGSVSCQTAQCSNCQGRSDCPGTDPHERYVLLGYPSQQGENIAAGYPHPLDVVCGWMNSPGHRANILNGDYDDLGVGLWAAPSSCVSPYWTQTFGVRPDHPAPGYLAAAGILPGSPGPPFGTFGAAATAVAYVNAPGAAAAPQTVRAVVDGRCVALARALGQEPGGLFAASFDAPAGCHELWFVAVDAAGARHVFPPDAAMAFAVGDATCVAPATRTLAACEGADACAVEGATKACYSGPAGTAGLGACHGGHRRCTDGAYGPCEAEVAPAAETCNGLDDDCNGEVDDALPAEAPCATGLPGRCEAGHGTCVAGSLVCVADREPVPETCNGEDDDCDGEVDDGLGSLACGTGACRRVLPACAGGLPQDCPAPVPSVEVCGNGLDDDCDGSADEGCACTVDSRSCYVGLAATLGVGPCRAGVQRCEGGVWGACVGQVLPTGEACNGVDDDCNHAVDEGLGREACGTGACRATTARCVAGRARRCEPVAPKAEACNGRDDSCDGVVDEGCRCRAGQEQACFSGDWSLVGVGSCRAGRRTCLADGSGPGPCVGELLATAELCRNGLDDDCNGLVDDGCPAPVPAATPADGPRGCGCFVGEGGFGAALACLAVARRRRRP